MRVLDGGGEHEVVEPRAPLVQTQVTREVVGELAEGAREVLNGEQQRGERGGGSDEAEKED